jgi:hypothetical protein
MKTPLHLEETVYDLLSIPTVTDTLEDGELFLTKRPVGHKKIAVVIKTLAVTGEQLQKAVVNVNIHVPNLINNIDGQPDMTQPDRNKLNEIAAVVIEALKNGILDDTVTGIGDAVMIDDPELQEHYMNIRIETSSINI